MKGAGLPVAAHVRGALDATCEVSIVVVTYRSAEHVEACLESVECALAGRSAEVVVVDNGSDDDTVALVRRSGLDAIVIERDNDGFARGCRAGADAASGRRLLFVNPDVVLGDGAVAALLYEMDEHPRAGVVGGRIVDADGRSAAGSWWGRPTLWSLLCFATGLSSARPGHRWCDPEASSRWNGESRPVDVVSGAVMLVDRVVWDRLGGFDPTLLLYGEDADLSLRARAIGYRPRVSGRATFVHALGGSASDPGSRLVLVLRGKTSVIRRHLPRGARELGVMLLLAGVRLRASMPGRPRRSTTDRAAWARAWRERGRWTRGWRPGDVLGGPS